MRLKLARPLSAACSIMLVFVALMQTQAFSADSPGYASSRHTAILEEQGGPQSIEAATKNTTERHELFQRFESQINDEFDLQDMQVPPKPEVERLDSQLNQVLRDARSQSFDLSAEPGLVSEGSMVAVTIQLFGETDDFVAELSQYDALVANTLDGVVEAYVPVDQLRALAGHRSVISVRALSRAQYFAPSQGVEVMGSVHWNANGYSGAGVKVGVIDGGFAKFSQLAGIEVPSSVVARCYSSVGSYSSSMADCENGVVHGTAVVEAVVDVAPQASIYISNPISQLDLQQTAAWMASQGVTVINHSVGWLYDGPGNGTSFRSQSPLRTVDTAIQSGVTWVNAAGNSAESNWFGAYVDSDGDGWINFASGIESNVVPAYKDEIVAVQMRWADSWAASSIDLDIVAVNQFGQIVGASDNYQTGLVGHEPFEFLVFQAPADGLYTIGVRRVSGSVPEWIQVQPMGGRPLGITTNGWAITNPAESANTGLLAVGASNWTTFGTIEPFSSQGPTPDGRVKPDIVGVDQTYSTAYGTAFPGTSQASPHVAGLAALVKQRYQHYTPAQIADYLKSNAMPRGGSTPNNTWGYGLAHLPEIIGTPPTPTATAPPSTNAFDDVWNTTDQTVASGQASYSWFWGPDGFHESMEGYVNSPGGVRQVRYYDKSRMEINDPNGDRNSIYYVTNGLLTSELVTGRMQNGDSEFAFRFAANVPVAGDPVNNPGTPSYALFAPFATTDGATNRAPDLTGQEVTSYLYGSGSLGTTAGGGVYLASHQSATGHNIASVFWDWANSTSSGFRPDQGVNWLYVLGFPISEPYWIDSTVGGVPKRVLVQLFERRVLTYTPSNPAQYQIEFGNIGRHYYQWRYIDSPPPTPTPTPTATPPIATPTPTATMIPPTSTPTLSPTASPTFTSTATGTPPGQIPTEGQIIFQPSMSQLDPYTSSNGLTRAYWDDSSSSYIIEDANTIGSTSSGFFTWWQSSSAAPTNYSITIDVVTLNSDTSSDSEAGVFYRLESSGSQMTETTYTGLASDGWLASWYLGSNVSVLSTYHAASNFNSGFGAVNQIKVLVKGNRAWVFVNGSLDHDIVLDPRSDTSANGFAFAVYRFGNSVPVTKYGFRNLVIRAVN